LSVAHVESRDQDWEDHILGFPFGGVALQVSGMPDLLQLVVSWRNLKARVCFELIASALRSGQVSNPGRSHGSEGKRDSIHNVLTSRFK
jgi:hypothetical protein